MFSALLIVSLSVAALESLAFFSCRWALRADGHPRRATIITLGYWIMTAALLAALLPALLLNPHESDGSVPVSDTLIIAAMALYLPKVVLAVFTLFELARRGFTRVFDRALHRSPVQPGRDTRSRFVPRLGAGLAAILFATILWEAGPGRGTLEVRRHEALSDSLPREFDGLRIVHLSDFHVASLGADAPRMRERLAAAVNAENADLIVYTGDYGTADEFDAHPDFLGSLQARLGKFAVLGNHDFGHRERAEDNWTSAEDKRRKIDALAGTFESRGFRLLMNEAATVAWGASEIAVLGVGVHDSHHGFHDADLATAERTVGNAAFRLLLAHTPELWESDVRSVRPIELTLVGHTHGAQIGFGFGRWKWSPAALEFRYWGGFYQAGRQLLNVNCGMGYVGLPFRLNMPADLSVIVLRVAVR